MTIKVVVETVDELRRRLAVEVPAEEVSAELEKAYLELGRAAKVRGFRPGRVPRSVLERLFGDRVRADVFDRLIQQSYTEAIEERQLAVVANPEIVTEQARAGEPLRYSATVEVKPEFAVAHYTGLEVERPLAPVTEADVDVFMERLRESFAQLRPILDRSRVEAGDVVTLDYEVRVDGRLIGRGESRQVEIGANAFPEEFNTRLLGAAVGSELDFPVTYPPEHTVAELAGRTAQFHVRIQALSHKELPALDDEFAKDHGECATFDELRQRVRARLEAEAGRQADDAMRDRLLRAVTDANDIPIPSALVQRRTDALVQEVWREWQQRRIRPKNQAEAETRLREELGPRARQQVKVALLLEAIARQEGITISEGEVEDRIATLATDAGAAADRVRALYQAPEARQDLRARMVQARAVDVVVAAAKIHTVERATSVAEASENG